MTTRLNILICLSLLFGSCAKQSTPTGGPKDTIPPNLSESYPAKNQVNVQPSTLEMTFDEHVILNNAKEQILIIPDIDKKYEVKAKKNQVTIELKEPLLPNTTYSINFREAIQDITEKNPAENLKIAFSTGTYVDSLVINGKVLSPLDNKPVKDATVALYQSDTFNIFKHKPLYITKTNDKGEYSIENLKPGQYFIYALIDKNKNLIVDSRNENYAFQTKPLQLQENTAAGNLNMIRLDMRPLKLMSARPYNTYFNIKFSKGLREYKLTTPDMPDIISIISDDHTTIKIFDNISTDSAAITLSAIDSIDNKIDTTFYFKFLSKTPTPEKFTVAYDKWSAISSPGKIQGSITYNKPLARINYDSIYYQVDSLRVVHFDSTNTTHMPELRTIKFVKDVPPEILLLPKDEASSNKTAKPNGNQNYQLYFGKAAFISIENDSSQQATQNLKPLTQEETASLLVQIETTQPFFVVQLLNKNFQEIASFQNKKRFQFQNIPPGEYQLRLIIDSDNNGRWSPGNIFKHIETEPVRYYMTEKKSPIINLKANWEVGPLLITY